MIIEEKYFWELALLCYSIGYSDRTLKDSPPEKEITLKYLEKEFDDRTKPFVDMLLINNKP